MGSGAVCLELSRRRIALKSRGKTSRMKFRTLASSSTLYEVGFNHIFRGKEHNGIGDALYIQGHASPGIYSRAFLEGRITREQISNFRQEAYKDGLSSYPHPRLMPDFWEYPTVSMGLGPLGAVMQARFWKYLHQRNLADTSESRVFAFLGDGEMDEPEAIAGMRFKRDKLTIKGIALTFEDRKDFEIIDEYVQTLRDNKEFSENFTRIKYVGHQKVNIRGQNIIRFEILASIRKGGKKVYS